MEKNKLLRAFHQFEGLLRGIGADKLLNLDEVNGLRDWMEENKYLDGRYPFSTVFKIVESILESKLIDEDLFDELLEYCGNFEDGDGILDFYERDLIRLFGFLKGVIIDKKVEISELNSLVDWLESSNYLNTESPFKEIHDIVKDILLDGVVSKKEEETFIKLISSFNGKDSEILEGNVELNFDQVTHNNYLFLRDAKDIFDNTVITFKNKRFLLVGKFDLGKKKEIKEKILTQNGIVATRLNSDLDYLIIGSQSNSLLTQSTVATKIKKAIEIKSKHSKPWIISEATILSLL